MGKQKISQRGKTLSHQEKQQRLEERYTEWTGNEVQIKYGFIEFLLEQDRRRNSKATIDHYKRTYKKLIAYYNTLFPGQGEQMPVDEFTQPLAQQMFVKSLGNVNDITINSYLRDYRAFGNFFEEMGYIKGFKCPIKKVEPEIKQVYTEKELQILMKKPNINDFVALRSYTVISLILATGARSNTILNLKLKDVDLEEGYVNYNTTKAHKVVRLKLPEQSLLDLTMFIDRWRSFDDTDPEEDYVFCNDDGEQLSRRALAKAIAQYNKNRGVNKTSIHLFRHTYVKNWITSGGDIIALAQVLTHSELDMVKKYANLYKEDIGEKIEAHAIINNLPAMEKKKSLKTKSKN